MFSLLLLRIQIHFESETLYLNARSLSFELAALAQSSVFAPVGGAATELHSRITNV